jgi:hypothetical protein
MKSVNLIISAAMLAFLAACGGGGGGSPAATSTQPTVIGVTVATGAPVIGAQITVVDSLGNSEDCTGSTNDEGKLSCSLSSAKTPPYFIRAQQKSMTLYAVLPDASSSVNVTPVSGVMARKFASDNSLEPATILGNPESMKNTTKASAQSAVDLVNAIVKVIAQQTAGITIDNALTQAYTPSNTNDAFDKFVHNINISSDVSGINLSIPTSAGTVSVSVAYNTSSSAATSAVTSSTANVSANLSDSDAIETVFNNFITDLNSCSTTSKQRMTSSISGTYMEGRTIADWVTHICNVGLPAWTKTYTRSLARFGNKSINVIGLKTNTGELSEITFAFIKQSGTWKLLADDMPVNMSLKTRHALEYLSNDSLTGKQKTVMKYQRYVDTWVSDESDRQIAGAMPQTIELYAIEMKNAEANWKAGNFPTTPDITVTKNTSCGGNPYTAYSNACTSFAQDTDFPALFSRLEQSDYTLVVMKLKDINGNCTNCDADGIPRSGTVIGRALTISKLFGSDVTAAQLAQGIPITDLPVGFEKNARVYFAAPSNDQLTQLTNQIMSADLTNKITVPWQRATGKKQQIDGVWGGVNSCSPNSSWTGLNEPTDSYKLTSNQWEFVYSPSNKTFKNASWVSFTIANRVNESEFAFYINTNRNVNCVP